MISEKEPIITMSIDKQLWSDFSLGTSKTVVWEKQCWLLAQVIALVSALGLLKIIGCTWGLERIRPEKGYKLNV